MRVNRETNHKAGKDSGGLSYTVNLEREMARLRVHVEISQQDLLTD